MNSNLKDLEYGMKEVPDVIIKDSRTGRIINFPGNTLSVYEEEYRNGDWIIIIRFNLFNPNVLEELFTGNFGFDLIFNSKLRSREDGNDYDYKWLFKESKPYYFHSTPIDPGSDPAQFTLKFISSRRIVLE